MEKSKYVKVSGKERRELRRRKRRRRRAAGGGGGDKDGRKYFIVFTFRDYTNSNSTLC